jgi:two-component system NarL family sensor kinase
LNDTNLPELISQIKKQQSLLKGQLDIEQKSLSELAKRLWAQQESEKAQLSRDLHDGVGQLLTGLTRRLEGLAKDQPNLAELVHISQLALADVRQLSRLMSPTILDDLGLESALKWLCRSLFENENISLTQRINLNITPSKELGILVFRIAQESLVNMLKYANAQEAQVFLSSHHNTIRLDIIDDGIGFDKQTVENGIGLRSMQDRARAFDASLDIISTINKGTRITLTVGVT